MNTTDRIMALADEYMRRPLVDSRDGSTTRNALRAEIDELVRDAERYRFALDDRDFAVCEFNDERKRWIPIKNNEPIDAAMQEKQS